MTHQSRHPAASLPRGPTDAGTLPWPGGCPLWKPQPLSQSRCSTLTIVLNVHEASEGAPARLRCPMIEGAAAGTEVLPLTVLLAACGPPPENSQTGTLLILSPGPVAHRPPPPWLRPPTPRQRPVRGSGITRPLAST
jgi:hypothetical protein